MYVVSNEQLSAVTLQGTDANGRLYTDKHRRLHDCQWACVLVQVKAIAMRMHVGSELPDEYFEKKHQPGVC